MSITTAFSDIKKPLVLLMLVGLLVITSQQQAQANKDTPIKLAIFPYFSAAQLIKLHKPLKQELAAKTKQNLQMLSAPNFKSFVKNTAKQQYDIIITAPHLGRIAQTNNGYQLLGFTSNTSNAVFSVKKDSQYKTLGDLKGTTITLPPKTAIIHQLALEKLKEVGLTPGEDIKIRTTKSHNNAMISVIEDITPSAAFGRPTWSKFKPDGRDTIHLLDQSEDIPGFAILAHPRLGKKLIGKIQVTLIRFEQTIAGRNYFNQSGLKGFRLANNDDLQQMDFYLQKIANVKKANQSKP